MKAYEFSLSRDDMYYHLWRIATFEAAKISNAALIREWAYRQMVYLSFNGEISQSLIMELMGALV